MKINKLVTSATHTKVDARTGKQRAYWVEIQLVDEEGSAIGGIPWQVESHHPSEGRIEAFTHSGTSDPEGLIRIDMPHGLELRLTLTGDSLAAEMEKRHLRVGRDAEVDSIVRPHAEEKGYIWHYRVIGEICRTKPSIEFRENELWPPFHFPYGKSYRGLTIRTNELKKRHVVEICPFRAWELILHHQKDYSLANAINLGAAASLAYADDSYTDKASITSFFINQCQDLSQLPQLHKSGISSNTLVEDVPFSERYYPPVFMDTSQETVINGGGLSEDENPSGSEKEAKRPDGDTQVFYVYNRKKIIIAWRGTASLYDVGTDLAFRPIETKACDGEKITCSALLDTGKVHQGFWNGYNRIKVRFPNEIDMMIDKINNRGLFICGHSLGGALALIHTAFLKKYDPVLYTYGMPRTFTRDAVNKITGLIHYRHVNDNDPVPGVPPEANLDNELYRLWGPVGTILGGLWSTLQLTQWQLIEWGDCFWHHGNPVAFITVSQSRQWQQCKVDLPYPRNCMTIRKRLPRKAKLYLVPALAEQEIRSAGEQQQEFIKTLTKQDMTEFFPAGGNPDRSVDLTFNDHFMTSYMPCINNKLLEVIDKEGFSGDRSFKECSHKIDLFKEQILENKDEISSSERKRNEIFIGIDGLLRISISATLKIAYGNTAISRFAKYGEEFL